MGSGVSICRYFDWMEGQAIARRWPPGPTRDLSVPPRSASINPVVLSGAMDVFLPFKALRRRLWSATGLGVSPHGIALRRGSMGSGFPGAPSGWPGASVGNAWQLAQAVAVLTRKPPIFYLSDAVSCGPIFQSCRRSAPKHTPRTSVYLLNKIIRIPSKFYGRKSFGVNYGRCI